MAYNRNLYSSDTDALDAGIIYDQNETKMQDEINAAIKNGDIVVGQADNLASKMNQFSTGEFIERTTGGDASLSDGNGHLVLIRGNMIHTGYIAKSVNMTVTPIPRDPSAGEFTAQIDSDLFLAEMLDTSGTMVFTYGSSGWDYDPANYGITTDGLPLPGDVISVVYQKEVRGTITQSNPQTFVSTGWNLYDHSKGYARALYYNDNPRFGITGTYTSVQYSLTITGAKSSVTPDANGTFGIPTDGNGGYIWVNGGNDTDTAVWMCWSDWTNDQIGKEPNGGVWEAYSESEIDLSTIMATYFANGLMAVGSYHDEIDLSLGKVAVNVGKMTYTEENLDDIIALGVDYDYDNSYIYYGLTEPVVAQITIDNTYTAYDHGIEYFTVTTVPIYTQTLYGVNLKNRLERDVITISQQTLNASEQSQIAANLNVVKKSGDTISGQLRILNNAILIDNGNYAVGDKPTGGSSRYLSFRDKNATSYGWVQGMIGESGNVSIAVGSERTINGTAIYNTVRLSITENGDRTISFTEPAAWRTALNAVNKTGDIITGDIYHSNSRIFLDSTTGDSSVTPSSNIIGKGVTFRDKNSVTFGYVYPYWGSSGNNSTVIGSQRVIDSSTVYNELYMGIGTTGTRSIYVTEAAPWLKAFGIDNKILHLTGVSCSATTGNFVNYNNSAITADHVVVEATFADPAAIVSPAPTWTTSAGNIKINGICLLATTVELVLAKKDN